MFPCHRDPSQARHAAGRSVNRGSSRAAAGRRGTFSLAAASTGTRGGGAELPRGARVWDTQGAGACLIFLEGSLARRGVPPRLASQGSSSLRGHSCWALPAPGPRVTAACPQPLPRPTAQPAFLLRPRYPPNASPRSGWASASPASPEEVWQCFPCPWGIVVSQLPVPGNFFQPRWVKAWWKCAS